MWNLEDVGKALSDGIANFIENVADAIGPICDALTPGDCPCCGAPAKIISREKKRETKFAIMCTDQNCLLRTAWTSEYLEALNSWNRRAASNEKDSQKRR